MFDRYVMNTECQYTHKKEVRKVYDECPLSIDINQGYNEYPVSIGRKQVSDECPVKVRRSNFEEYLNLFSCQKRTNRSNCNVTCFVDCLQYG